MTQHSESSIYVVNGLRTPQLKSMGKPGAFSASDLAVVAARQLLLKVPVEAKDLDEVIIGCVMPDASEANIARQIALRIGCQESTPAWTVQRNCASGLQAVDSGMTSILTNKADLVLVGGTEAMSRAPLLWNDAMVNWIAQMYAIRGHGVMGLLQRLGHFLNIRPHFLKPVISLLKGLKDPLVGLSMGQTAENLAYRFHISRSEMDQYALQSHQRLSKAIDDNLFAEEITPLYDTQSHFYDRDNGVRADSNLIKLSQLRAVFDKKYGNVTAGNSAQVSDGATMLLLASEKAVEQYQLPVLGKLIDCQWQGLAPEEMGLGPAHAIAPLLKEHELSIADIDYWEINEAFAAQVLACQKALDDDDYCQSKLGLDEKLGLIPNDKLNLHGGGISLGHPVGASGARIVLHLLNLLKRQKAQRGVASLCIGGGQGGALLVESMQH